MQDNEAPAARVERELTPLDEIRTRIAQRAGSTVNTETEGQAISDSMFLLAALDAVLEKADEWSDRSVSRPLVTRPYAAEVFFAAAMRSLRGADEPEADHD